MTKYFTSFNVVGETIQIKNEGKIVDELSIRKMLSDLDYTLVID